MAKILIAGALDFRKQESRDLVRALGAEVIAQNHVLVNGCRNEFDRLMAESADQAARQKHLDPTTRITSYAVSGSMPAHDFGTVLRSRLETWGLEFESLHVPEPIHEADAVIIVGGQEGTLCAANWARIDRKPLLPVTICGGAALAAYNEELKEFETKYDGRIDRHQFEVLNQITGDMAKIAKDAVALAARVQASTQVFVIMAFSGDPKLQDAYDSFQEVCREFGYETKRVDQTNCLDRIVPQILEGIRRSAFVIADVTEAKANVYYEFGLAQGMGKPYVVTAYEGTVLPFDVHDIPTLFWGSQKRLKEMLRQKVQSIAATQGRHPQGIA